MKLIKLLANLGYGSRKEVSFLIRDGRLTNAQGEPIDDDFDGDVNTLRVDDEPIDPPPGLVLMLNKPLGYTCSTADAGNLVYELLPPRFAHRSPALSSVGRLDKDTSGLLLFTDDGQLLHRLTSPKAHIAKVYEVTLANDLKGDEGVIFGAGTLLLESEKKPLAPAQLLVLEPRRIHLTTVEGRYHQVRRMFAAVGNHVLTLRRVSMGTLALGDLPEGEFRYVTTAEIQRLLGTGS